MVNCFCVPFFSFWFSYLFVWRTMQLIAISHVGSESWKKRNEVRPSMLKSFLQSFGAAVWAFNTQDSKYFLLLFSVHLDHFVCAEMNPLFCLSVRHHRDYRDLCVRWVPQVLTHAQGTVHSRVLRVLLHHGISYDHSGNGTVFERHRLSPVPLWWLLSSCTSCKSFRWILPHVTHDVSENLFLKNFLNGCSDWDILKRLCCSNLSENQAFKIFSSQTSPK